MWINYGYLLIVIAVNEIAAKVYPITPKYDQNIVKAKSERHKRQFGFPGEFSEEQEFGSNRQNNDYPNNSDSIFFDEDYMFLDSRPNRPAENQNVPNNPNFFDDDRPARITPNSNGPTTQRPLGVTGVNIPGMGTTRSACEDDCFTTGQYNPVCGDNNVTYLNIERFRCAVRCGRNIRILAYRACPRIMVK